MDWKQWHDRYDGPDSDWTRRLRTVRTQISAALDEAPAGPLHAVSMCAGQGRDLIPVLAEHPRGRDVHARLVELDPGNAEQARHDAASAGLARVEVVTGDAGLADHYLDLAPADLVLICGVYGNLELRDIENTIATCAALCATGGTVIWTRGRSGYAGDLVPQVLAWHAQYGFDEIWTEEPGVELCVGAHRYAGTPTALEPGSRIFEFLGYDVLEARYAGR